MPKLDIEYTDCSGPRYGSSIATRNRRKAKRKKKGGKPGHPGSFSSGRLQLFEEYQEEFNGLTRTVRTPQNEFWQRFFKKYWGLFPYTVPLKEDPSESAWPLPDEEVFTDEQRQEKGAKVAAVVSVCVLRQTSAI